MVAMTEQLIDRPAPSLTVEKVRAALTEADGSPKGAAAILGVSRQTIHKWMNRHDIRVERVVR